MERIPSSADLEDNRAVKLAYELAMLGLAIHAYLMISQLCRAGNRNLAAHLF